MAGDFERFFKQATRCAPFPHQRRLADPTSDLPELLPPRRTLWMSEAMGALTGSLDPP